VSENWAEIRGELGGHSQVSGPLLFFFFCYSKHFLWRDRKIARKVFGGHDLSFNGIYLQEEKEEERRRRSTRRVRVTEREAGGGRDFICDQRGSRRLRREEVYSQSGFLERTALFAGALTTLSEAGHLNEILLLG
jgi:hypothetical protein